MNSADFSLGIKDQTGSYEVSLHEVGKSSKNTVVIAGKNYKILGSEAAVSKLRSNMVGSSFENVSEFTASVNKNLKSHGKTEVVFQEIMGLNSDSPVGKAEKQFWKWLSSFNSGEENQIREFKNQFKKESVTFNLDDTMDFFVSCFEDTQGFNFIKVIESSPTQVKVLLQEQCKFQEFAILTIDVDPEKPHQILNINLSSADIEHEPVQRMSEAEALKAIDLEINHLEKQGKFSGTVLVTKVGNPTPLISRSVGKSKLETQTDNTLQTQYNLASMGKMFTVVGIHQLAEAGKIDLKKPISEYLPDVKDSELGKVTIEQLLTHTGGTGGLSGVELKEDLGPKEYVKRHQDRELEFAPGAHWKYSNFGFILLGAVIEEVSGENYHDYIQKHVFENAEMTHSDFHLKTDESSNTATGYIRKRDGLKNNVDKLPMRGSAAGGGYSSAEDLDHFGHALLENKLLNSASIQAISTPTIVANDGHPWSYTSGFQNGDLWFGHEGREGGINSELRIYPKAGYVVTVMGNLDPPAATNLAEFIGARLPAESENIEVSQELLTNK